MGCAASGERLPPDCLPTRPSRRAPPDCFSATRDQLWIQFVSIVATAAYTAVGTLIVIYITKLVAGGLRVDEDSEISGLDNALHGERGFEIA